MNYLTTIAFVGGPFDGHRVVDNPHQVGKRVAVPVTKEMILHGKTEGVSIDESLVTSVAVYHLLKSENRWRYRFIASQPPRHARL